MSTVWVECRYSPRRPRRLPGTGGPCDSWLRGRAGRGVGLLSQGPELPTVGLEQVVVADEPECRAQGLFPENGQLLVVGPGHAFESDGQGVAKLDENER